MRLEDLTDQEVRDLREQVSKLALDNRSLSSKITSQKEQSKHTQVSHFFIWYVIVSVISNIVGSILYNSWYEGEQTIQAGINAM